MADSVPVDPPVPTDTMLSIGPMLIGSLISYAIFGISVMQLYLYHLNFPRDSWKLKALVYLIFILDIFQSVTIAVMCWHALISGWGRPSALIFPGWSFSAVPAVSGIVALMVQSFYAWRIHLLGHWKAIPGIIIFFALAQCAGSLAIAIGFVPLKNVELLHKPNMNARTIVWLGGATLTDLMISISMLYWLYGARQTRFGETQRMINRLIRLTIETGVVTATTATLELIFFLAFPPSSGMHLLAALSLCKVYSNAFMTSLNSRSLGSSTRSKHSSSSGSRGTGSNNLTGGTLQWSTTTVPRTTFDERTGLGTVGTVGTGMTRDGAVIHIATDVETDGDDVFGRGSTGKVNMDEGSEMELQIQSPPYSGTPLQGRDRDTKPVRFGPPSDV